MNKITGLSFVFALVMISTSQFVFAESDQDKQSFASSLEETLGHFWALEQNLDDKNAELALIHATHPVAELYDIMKPQLKAADPNLDSQVQNTLLDLKNKANTDVSREDAQKAIDDAKEIVAIARSTVVGDKLSQDTAFKVDLIKTLLETSIAEYGEAISNGQIVMMAELQDGSAFVWRSHQIFNEIQSDLPEHEAEEIVELYSDLNAAYDKSADPKDVETITSSIIHEFDEALKPKIEFASSLEETLGHFWALEQNLDDKNAELALIHATHPVAELYDIMKPQLKAADPNLDSQVQNTLLDLKNKANTDVSREDAQKAIDDAKEIVAIARSTVVGDYLSSKVDTKLVLMSVLLETSIAEYGEAISNGQIVMMAELQDGSAFVWRSHQIFNEIQSDLPEHEAEEIVELYSDLNAAYDKSADPKDVETITSSIIHEINEILGVHDEEDGDLLVYVNEIKELLEQTKEEYANGNTDLALSLATKAYLDNFEFLEAPLVQAGQQELMEKVETSMRVELRDMIKNGAPSSEVNQKIDSIIVDMDIVQVAVPEFGTIAMMILAVAIISIIAVTAKARMIPRF